MNFKDYAAYYDLLYEEKDYESEVDFVEKLIEDYNPKEVLELGCGTGKYTHIFNERGYHVTGVDLSMDMIQIAKERCKSEFIQSDIRYLDLNKHFDLCIALFAVMGYINDNHDIIKVFKTIKNHLKPNGLFIFDVWNGLAVMKTLPEIRVKEIKSDNKTILRIAEPNLNSFNHVCEVNYRLLILDEKKNNYQKIKEKHLMRFFFPQELITLLESAGFEVLKICPFLDSESSLDENSWNMCVVARVVE